MRAQAGVAGSAARRMAKLFLYFVGTDPSVPPRLRLTPKSQSPLKRVDLVDFASEGPGNDL